MLGKKHKQPAAPPIETFKLGSRYYYARLNPNDRKYYRAIYDQWLTGSTEAHLIIPGTDWMTPDGTTFHDLVLSVVEDNPHLFHVERTHFQYFRKGAEVAILSNNIYTPEEFRETYEKLRRRVGQILAAARKFKTKTEQARFLHDYLAASITYDFCGENPRTAREAHTMVGALLNRRCVCDGYARAYRLLCDRMGISCIVVIGEGTADAGTECHGWNMIKLDQVPYHVDVTWDSNTTSGRLVKDFEFLRGDEFASHRHQWERDKYPRCPADWPRRLSAVATQSQLEARLEQQLKAGHKNFMVRLGGQLATKNIFDVRVKEAAGKYVGLVGQGNDLIYWFYESYGYAEFQVIRKG